MRLVPSRRGEWPRLPSPLLRCDHATHDGGALVGDTGLLAAAGVAPLQQELHGQLLPAAQITRTTAAPENRLPMELAGTRAVYAIARSTVHSGRGRVRRPAERLKKATDRETLGSASSAFSRPLLDFAGEMVEKQQACALPRRQPDVTLGSHVAGRCHRFVSSADFDL